MSSGQPSRPTAAKTALRDQLVTTRRRRSLVEIGQASQELARVTLAWTAVRRAATVCCYVSIGSEPGTTHLIDELAAAGKRVLLPVVLPDLDLDWAAYSGATGLRPARLGLFEPDGPRLGVSAVASADVVLVPGLAVSSWGMRMGRGGGSYDRALARVPRGTPTAVVLYDDEVGVEVPVEPHDRSVSVAITPNGIVQFRGHAAAEG